MTFKDRKKLCEKLNHDPKSVARMAVMLSLQPQWCKEILELRKRVEVRKTAPAMERAFKVYLYCTKGKALYRSKFDDSVMNGKVIGEFVCDWVFDIPPLAAGEYHITEDDLKRTGLTKAQLWVYGRGEKLYGWEISELKRYTTPRDLADFGLTKAPQSWCYIGEIAP